MSPSNPKEAKLDTSSDLDMSANQIALEDVDKCQNELDSLNEKASEEILAVEQKYNKLRRPYYVKRNQVIEAIPDFWCNALIHHPQVTSLLSAEEHECLRQLKSLDVEEFDDIKSGYKIKFQFKENDFFTNTELVKEFNLVSTSEPVSKSTSIDWKDGKNLIQKAEAAKKSNGRKRQFDSHPGFFSWFNNNEDPSMDEIAETIKDDLWVNPLQYYLGSDMENGHSDDDSEELDESVVEVGDDDDEDDEDDEDEDPEVYDVDGDEDEEGEEDDDDVEGEDGDDDDDE